MTQSNIAIYSSEDVVTQEVAQAGDPKETETDPKQKPEVEPEHLPKEDPGQPDPDEGDDGDDDDPYTDTEIGDDPDEIEKKRTIF